VKLFSSFKDNDFGFGNLFGGIKSGKLTLPSFGDSGGRLKIRWFKSAGFNGLDNSSWRTDAKRYAPPKPKRWARKKIHSAVNQNGKVWNASMQGAIRRPHAQEYQPSPGVVSTLDELDPEEWGLDPEAGEDEEHDSVWDLAVPLGDGENDNPGYQDWSELTTEEIRERCRAEVVALGRAWPRADEAQRHHIQERLAAMLGRKYTGLMVDFLSEGYEDDEELISFAATVVEAAVIDGGREPLIWKLQRAIRSLIL
jgi:hypothetical protein